VIHLDRLYWQPGWAEPDPDEFRAAHRQVIERDEWILDGNYTVADKQERLERADLVIVLETSRLTALARVVRREVLLRGQVRPDMADGCSEQLESSFLTFIWGWYGKHPRYGEEVRAAVPGKPVVLIRTPSEATAFVASASENLVV
jgi:adenylate kinase family enzyme